MEVTPILILINELSTPKLNNLLRPKRKIGITYSKLKNGIKFLAFSAKVSLFDVLEEGFEILFPGQNKINKGYDKDIL